MSNSELVTESRESKRAITFSIKFLAITFFFMFCTFGYDSLVYNAIGVSSFVAAVLFTFYSLRRQYKVERKLIHT